MLDFVVRASRPNLLSSSLEFVLVYTCNCRLNEIRPLKSSMPLYPYLSRLTGIFCRKNGLAVFAGKFEVMRSSCAEVFCFMKNIWDRELGCLIAFVERASRSNLLS